MLSKLTINRKGCLLIANTACQVTDWSNEANKPLDVQTFDESLRTVELTQLRREGPGTKFRNLGGNIGMVRTPQRLRNENSGTVTKEDSVTSTRNNVNKQQT